MSTGPGLILILGSGETSPFAIKLYDRLLAELALPADIAILETPAGFEPNSAQVAGRIAAAMRLHLSRHDPKISVVPARRRDTPLSPDDPAVSVPLFQSNFILLGPGSPTYAVRQLRDSQCWHVLLARHRLGAHLGLASAGAIAAGAYALPVYEIYKVGEELHWLPGLDFFGVFGLQLAIVPHWNNADGGLELDTRRCYMGAQRFGQLLRLLPAEVTVVGVDEQSAVLIDIEAESCEIFGQGGVTVITQAVEHRFEAGQTLALDELGRLRHPDPAIGLPAGVWQQAMARHKETVAAFPPDPEVRAVVEQREQLRERQDWSGADRLRQQLNDLGWLVDDTPLGPRLRRVFNRQDG